MTDRLPAAFLARILWQESRFRDDAVSPAGAEGVAQFMRPTAIERGLTDPRSPGPAITEAGRMLAKFTARFGNLGLAAAAYNAGAGRVARWLRAQIDLPAETRLYVRAVTGRAVEDWAARAVQGGVLSAEDRGTCLESMARIAHSAPAPPPAIPGWQLRLERTLAKVASLRSLGGTRALATDAPFEGAAVLCARIRSLGAHCVVDPP